MGNASFHLRQQIWHGCPKHAASTNQNAEFWRTEMLGNPKRDRAVSRARKKRGWRVVRIWEHALTRRHEARTVTRLRRILKEIRGALRA